MLKYTQSPLTTSHLHPLIYVERLVLKSGAVQMIGLELRNNVGMEKWHMAPAPASSVGIDPQWLNIKSQW